MCVNYPRIHVTNQVTDGTSSPAELSQPLRLRLRLRLATTRRNEARHFETTGELSAVVCRRPRPFVVVWGCLLLQYLA